MLSVSPPCATVVLVFSQSFSCVMSARILRILCDFGRCVICITYSLFFVLERLIDIDLIFGCMFQSRCQENKKEPKGDDSLPQLREMG